MRKPVPPLPDDLVWLNTGGPISWQQLRGKFVLLDFWTYCCINCMHVLPELKKLERKYPRELVVIGIHSAKFETERDADNITEAVLRYGIEHPVINDRDMRIWRTFGVNAWPTLVLIDPQGYAVWAASGETTFEALDELISRAMPFYEQQNLLDRTPIRFDTAARRSPRTPLRFPGKVAVDEESGRLFIADSSHNRIIVAGMDGALQAVIGSGQAGLKDGSFAEARFSQPQGMAVRGNEVYVADTQNHAIRRIDLAEQSVTTIAGTGRQLRQTPLIDPKPAKNADLSSPWDLCLLDDALYVAMAGCHQIWRMDLRDGRIGVYAGNAVEDIVDGKRLPPAAYRMGFASFAQPSGLASDGIRLFVADSEGSSIRSVPLANGEDVRTIVGTAALPYARLFTFGDRDGPREQVLLQHPLGVAYLDGYLYVADTYNNKIKRIQPEGGETVTLLGDGESGDSDQPPRFNEPGGIAAAKGRLFVADTNNHAIRVIELGARPILRTLPIQGLTPPETDEPADGEAWDDVVAQREKLRRLDAGDITLEITPPLPAGMKLNPGFPPEIRVIIQPRGPSNDNNATIPRTFRVESAELPLRVRLAAGHLRDAGSIEVRCTYFYCETEGSGLCRMGTARWLLPVEIAPGGVNVVQLTSGITDPFAL
ncbi:MAG: redoxin domain-containing protein [Thermogutta sp.]|nr:redoxin domain-containing protein [Thermogutta sp.]